MFKELGEFIKFVVEREVARSEARAERARQNLIRIVREGRREDEQLKTSVEQKRKEGETEKEA